MIPQPVFPEETTSTKKCWSCEERIPYNLGWCEVCWEAVPEKVKILLHDAIACGEGYAGPLRGAIAFQVHRLRFPPMRIPIPEKRKITLEDLGL